VGRRRTSLRSCRLAPAPAWPTLRLRCRLQARCRQRWEEGNRRGITRADRTEGQGSQPAGSRRPATECIDPSLRGRSRRARTSDGSLVAVAAQNIQILDTYWPSSTVPRAHNPTDRDALGAHAQTADPDGTSLRRHRAGRAGCSRSGGRDSRRLTEQDRRVRAIWHGSAGSSASVRHATTAVRNAQLHAGFQAMTG